jgi:hypothetical protein
MSVMVSYFVAKDTMENYVFKHVDLKKSQQWQYKLESISSFQCVFYPIDELNIL